MMLRVRTVHGIVVLLIIPIAVLAQITGLPEDINATKTISEAENGENGQWKCMSCGSKMPDNVGDKQLFPWIVRIGGYYVGVVIFPDGIITNRDLENQPVFLNGKNVSTVSKCIPHSNFDRSFLANGNAIVVCRLSKPITQIPTSCLLPGHWEPAIDSTLETVYVVPYSNVSLINFETVTPLESCTRHQNVTGFYCARKIMDDRYSAVHVQRVSGNQWTLVGIFQYDYYGNRRGYTFIPRHSDWIFNTLESLRSDVFTESTTFVSLFDNFINDTTTLNGNNTESEL